jgi:hypothetical protein
MEARDSNAPAGVEWPPLPLCDPKNKPREGFPPGRGFFVETGARGEFARTGTLEAHPP